MIRPARPQDVPQIHRLIRELAEYERSLDLVTATEEDLALALFADRPAISRTWLSSPAQSRASRCGS